MLTKPADSLDDEDETENKSVQENRLRDFLGCLGQFYIGKTMQKNAYGAPQRRHPEPNL
ncbi:hypothetical protein [Shinella sp. JR1-6]|uniref:hypothetical protein n=1 Tax=Shinella sp. JR1-6 TaxID=2527671 RepID=UPI0014047518|nr:hypothetical protein [Shinella sp. JR1-6]